MHELVIAAASGVIATYLFLRKIVIPVFPKFGVIGRDVHKPGSPAIPEMAGTAFLFGITIFMCALAMFRPLKPELVSMFSAMMIAGVIGVVDDLKKLGKATKPLLTMLSGLPLLLVGTTQEYLHLPLGVSFHIPTLYKLLAPIVLAVTSNAINMFDVMNGVATGTSLIVISFLSLAGLVKGFLGGMVDMEALIEIALMIIPSMLVIYRFNKYPARVFIGDSGSLSMGAAIGAFSIIFGVEVTGAVALMLPITNAFLSLSSFGGLFERSELKQRPIIVKGDGALEPNLESEAPITFTRLMLLLGYSSERELIEAYFQIVLMTSLIGLLVSLTLMTW